MKVLLTDMRFLFMYIFNIIILFILVEGVTSHLGSSFFPLPAGSHPPMSLLVSGVLAVSVRQQND